MSAEFHSVTGPFNQQYPHEVGLAMLIQSPSAEPGAVPRTAAVVLGAADGRLLAWDGWYHADGLPPSEHLTPLTDLLQSEALGTFPDEVIWERTKAWAQALGWVRNPTVQAGNLAARTLGTHWENSPLGSDWAVVAYFLTQLTLLDANRFSDERMAH